MDTPLRNLRAVAAQTLASVLLSAVTDLQTSDMLNGGETSPNKKNSNHALDDVRGDEQSFSVPRRSAQAQVYTLDFRDMLRHISVAYTRASSRPVRGGLVMTYALLFKSAGTRVIEANYQIILEHLLNEFVPGLLLGDNRHRIYSGRKHIQFLLCNILRRQLLNEPAKLMALQTISQYLEKGNFKTKENEAGPETLVVESALSALCEVAGILLDVGSATAPVQVTELNMRSLM